MGASPSRNSNVHVVVVGGGHAGIHAAKELDPHVRVTLVSPSATYFLSMASPRALVEDGFASKLFFPLDKLMTHGGAFLQGRAVTIAPDSVVVQTPDGATTTLAANYVIVATGAGYASPIFTDADAASATAQLAAARAAVAAAKSVLVVGGGAVGVEIAAEVKTDFPGCAVTLATSGAELLSEVSHLPPKGAAKLRTRTAAKLAKMGVAVVTGVKAERPAALAPGTAVLAAPGTVVGLSNGSTVTADVVVWAVGGGRPATAALAANFAGVISPNGRVRVAPTLQVEGCPSVFAIGDVKEQAGAKTPDPLMGFHASLQAKHVAKSIVGLTRGRPAALYKPGPPAMFLSLGRRGGQGAMGNLAMGDKIVGNLKSKSLFVPVVQGLFKQ